jgi:hypothetical protein
MVGDQVETLMRRAQDLAAEDPDTAVADRLGRAACEQPPTTGEAVVMLAWDCGMGPRGMRLLLRYWDPGLGGTVPAGVTAA